ncbi:polysaccharide deacetylase family protein [Butyricicoccus sp.]|uniref:polysaccharide deacetylase family protein n=1 Tax=Butyricicoccus sp. TaxID=2049021 RepID=UPI003736D178
MKFKQTFAALLCGAIVFGTAGCGLNPATGSQNAQASSGSGSSAEGSGQAAGSAAGSAVPAGGLEEEIEKNPIPQGEKYMAITFDDGPTGNEGGRTERLLDGLKERGVHATFFLCGYRIRDFNSMSERYLAEGHEVGNHTMNHVLLDREVSDGGLQQISSNSELIASYTGEEPTVMRPTGGAYNDTVRASMKQLGLPIILWSIDSLDWKYRDASSVKARIVENAEDGAIVLSHDLYETTVEGVLSAIDELQAQGYAFVTVSELAQLKGVTLEPGEVYSDFTDETLHPEEAEPAAEPKSGSTETEPEQPAA